MAERPRDARYFDRPFEVEGDVAHQLLGDRKLEGLPFHVA